MNRTQIGVPASTTLPVGVSFPVFWSMRNMMTLLVSWLAAARNSPLGWISKLRGILPRVLSWPTSVSVPFFGRSRR